MNIKAIIFDWGRTLYDSENKIEYRHASDILDYCQRKGYKLALVSLVTIHANATFEERSGQIKHSPLLKFFEIAEVTEGDKDELLDKIVEQLNLPRKQILIVDDRAIRGIRYGCVNGHPTVWFQNGKFSNELPTSETGVPTYVIHNLLELKNII